MKFFTCLLVCLTLGRFAGATDSSDASLIRAIQFIAPSTEYGQDDAPARLKLIKSIYTHPSIIKRACRTTGGAARAETYPMGHAAAVFAIPLKQDADNLYAVSCLLQNDSFRARFNFQEAVVANEFPTTYTFAINKIMREGDPAEIAKIQPIISLLISSFSKYPDFAGPVLRGTGPLPSAVLLAHAPGRIVQYPNFLSTTVSESIAERYETQGGWRFEIQSKTCKDIRNDVNPYEQEITCLPGSKFQVISRDDSAHVIKLIQLP